MFSASRQFEEILDRCIVAMQTRGQTVEECLAQYPQARAELEPLLRLAVRLQRARALTAPTEFRQTAAVRMQNLITATSAPGPRPFRQPLARGGRARIRGTSRLARAAVLVSALLVVLLVLSSGALVASANALPGEPLYSVKTTVERWQLALTPSEAGAAQLRMTFAARRLQEATALVERGQPARAEGALAGYADQVELVLALLETEARLSPQARNALAQQLNRALHAYQAQLTALQARTGTLRPAALDRALLVSQSSYQRSMLLLDEESSELPAVDGPAPAGPAQPTALGPSATPTATPTLLADTATPIVEPTASAPGGAPPPELPPQPTDTRPALPPRPPRPTATPTDLPTRRPAPERTALPTLRPPRPTDLPTRPVLLPTRPLRPTDLPPVRPPVLPTDAPPAQPTAWPTWPTQTVTPWPTPMPWPTPTVTPGEPTSTPPAPPDFAPPRPPVPPGLRETITAVPRPRRTPAP